LSTQQPTYIDLFAGCGGLSLGLHNAGWKGLFAIEKNSDAFETLKFNLIEKKDHFAWPTWLDKSNHDIDEILRDHKEELINLRGKVDLIAGGPPCQGFSSAGKRYENDVRNGLVRSYLKFVMYVRPKVIFFENVKGFTLAFEKNKEKGQIYRHYVERVLRFFGYDVAGKMVNFSEYGIPQKRTRFILVAVRRDDELETRSRASGFFDLLQDSKFNFLKSKRLPQAPSVGMAISDLLKSNGLVETPDRNGFYSGKYGKESGLYQRYLKKGAKGKSPNSHSFPVHRQKTVETFLHYLNLGIRNKRIPKSVRDAMETNKHTIIPLGKKMPCPTLTTLPDDYIHFEEPRILTVREYARIQSFPDWYEFKGKYTTGGKVRTKEVPRYSQIGNAIPPLFGEQCGNTLKEILTHG
jgi:DNA (cytosine-5)-methyltransferase 1